MHTAKPTNGNAKPENGKVEPNETGTDTATPDNQTQTTPRQEPEDQPDEHTPVEAPAPKGDSPDPRLEQARRDSANYRRQLRAVEEEVKTLRSELDTVYRQRIQAELPKGMPAKAFWLTYKDSPQSLLDDNLQPDVNKLREAVTTAYDQLGLEAETPQGFATASKPIPRTGLGVLNGRQGWSGIINQGPPTQRG